MTAAGFVDTLLSGIQEWVFETVRENLFALAPAGYAFFRSMGRTVESGNTGLLFSLGRATTVVEPGFRFLIPFFQKLEVVPTRARTLDLAEQRLTNFEGLVYEVDVNLVYRIVDVRKALVEVDDLERAMRELSGISVMEVLWSRSRTALSKVEGLDGELERALAGRLEAWGVVIEQVGFTSIRASRVTLRLVQLGDTVRERRRGLASLVENGLALRLGLPLVSGGILPRRRALRAIDREIRARARVRRRARIVRVPAVPTSPTPRASQKQDRIRRKAQQRGAKKALRRV